MFDTMTMTKATGAICGSLLVYLFLHDTWFYWTHRWMHRPKPFRIAHAVHHASRPPTAWAAMSFHPWEAVTGAVFIAGVLVGFIILVSILVHGVTATPLLARLARRREADAA